jgi:hypothetical protein
MKTVTALLVLGASAAVAAPLRAAETWIQCDGTVITSGATQESKPVHEVYVYDDDTRHLFKYSDSRKSLDAVFVTNYAPREIAWSSPSGATYADARWEGRLDRTTNALSIVRHERGETMTWTETCKPAQPLDR